MNTKDSKTEQPCTLQSVMCCFFCGNELTEKQYVSEHCKNCGEDLLGRWMPIPKHKADRIQAILKEK